MIITIPILIMIMLILIKINSNQYSLYKYRDKSRYRNIDKIIYNLSIRLKHSRHKSLIIKIRPP